MTYLILPLFVFGVSVVINFMADFWTIDLDRVYEQRRVKSVFGESYEPRPRWQQFIMKPTIYFNVCMSSFWSAVCYFGLLGLSSFPEYILHSFTSAGLIYLINKL